MPKSTVTIYEYNDEPKAEPREMFLVVEFGNASRDEFDIVRMDLAADGRPWLLFGISFRDDEGDTYEGVYGAQAATTTGLVTAAREYLDWLWTDCSDTADVEQVEVAPGLSKADLLRELGLGE